VTGMPAQRGEPRVPEPALHLQTGVVTGAQTLAEVLAGPSPRPGLRFHSKAVSVGNQPDLTSLRLGGLIGNSRSRAAPGCSWFLGLILPSRHPSTLVGPSLVALRNRLRCRRPRWRVASFHSEPGLTLVRRVGGARQARRYLGMLMQHGAGPRLLNLWALWDSNPGPTDYESCPPPRLLQ
jgi:hypothetical protein